MAAKERFVIDPVDSLPTMIVGRWVTEVKHEIIRRYIHISYGARAKYNVRTYIDLFSGSGRIKVKHLNNYADGGPLAAWKMAKLKSGSFTDFYIADANPLFLEACKIRLDQAGAPCSYFQGVADKTIDLVLDTIPKRGLHLALLDPYNAGNLHFSIIQKLSELERVDIVVHLSTGDIRRNVERGLRSKKSVLDNVAPGWKEAMPINPCHREMVQYFIQHWEKLVTQTGLYVCDEKHAVKNSQNSTMYHLCMLTRHPQANRFWTDACKINPTRSLFL